MRRGRKFPSDLRSPSTFTPAAYRLDAFRINYRKVDLIGTYVYLAFQKPFRESPSSETSHSRSRGQLHDRNEKRLPQRSPAPLAMPLASLLVAICLLLWMVQNTIKACKSDSLVGGNSKRMTPPPFSSSCVGSDSRRGISPSHYAELFSETENDALSAIESSLSLGLASATLCAIRGRSSCFLCENTKRIARSSKPQVFSRKCAPASSLSSASCSLGVTSAPFSHCTTPWRSSSSPTSSSSFPTPQSTSSPPDT